MTTTAERLKELLTYDPETGIFRWKVSPKHRATVIKPGDEAGYIKSGPKPYRYITIDNITYMAHRLAHLYMTGVWPPHQIDHRDCNKSNNAWGNLRPATNGQNQANRPLQKRNTSGLKGAHYKAAIKKWIAQIRHNGRQYHIGVYNTAREAHEAYCAEARRLHGEFWHDGQSLAGGGNLEI